MAPSGRVIPRFRIGSGIDIPLNIDIEMRERNLDPQPPEFPYYRLMQLIQQHWRSIGKQSEYPQFKHNRAVAELFQQDLRRRGFQDSGMLTRQLRQRLPHLLIARGAGLPTGHHRAIGLPDTPLLRVLRLFPVREKPMNLRLVSTPRFEKGTVAHVNQPE